MIRILPRKYQAFLAFTLLTGLRPSESVMSTNKITELHKHDRSDEYYNARLSILEHFKYREFLRGSKNVFISFISPILLSYILEIRPKMNYRSFQLYMIKRNPPVRTNYLRKLLRYYP